MPPQKSPAVDAYIASQPEDVRPMLEELRQTIRKAAPQTVETIDYGIPTYQLNGNVVHFGGFRHHIGFYPTPSGMIAFGKELKPFKQTRGTVKFPIDEPLPLDLITRITMFRVHENKAKKKVTRHN